MARSIVRTYAIRFAAVAAVGLCALTGAEQIRAQQRAVPSHVPAALPAAPPMPNAQISGILPVVVNVPANLTPEQSRPYFDDFSWRSFIALNWPAVPDKRGVPQSPNDPSVFFKAGAAYAGVWGTFRDAYDLYRIDNVTPVAFASASATNTVCGPGTLGSKILLMAAKSGSLLQDVDQAFSYPLVDQNNNYVYYEISSPQPYRQGAVMVKAAWKQMTAADDASRYYTVKATIYDASQRQPACRNVTMGLIGFHIGHKVDGLAQWVWSSFEQVDNVPNDDGTKPAGAMTLNNGTESPKTVGGWANRPELKREVPADKRTKAQITRLNPIPTTPAGQSTVDINKAWRKVLEKTVWTNYQLVITQWPSSPVPQSQFKPKENQGVYPQDSGQPFPVNNAVNTAIESFFQSQNDAAGAGGNSCMQCHYGAGIADFSWSLVLRSK